MNKVNLEFIGMKQVKELSTIQSVVTKPTTFFEDLAEGNYAIGFTSADFIMWDLRNETKVLLCHVLSKMFIVCCLSSFIQP